MVRAVRESVCDLREPWEHGTVLRASRFPSWWDRNLVRVEDALDRPAAELIAFADQALQALEHRMISFEDAATGERYRADLERAGYRATRLVWMLHEDPGRFSAPAGVLDVPYDLVEHLRAAWHQEDFPGLDFDDFNSVQRQHALEQRARTLASFAGGAPVGFSAVDPVGREAEVGAVFVLPPPRAGPRERPDARRDRRR